MPYAPPPAGAPEGVYHHDFDPENVYRIPASLTEDYFVFYYDEVKDEAGAVTQPARWIAYTDIQQTDPFTISEKASLRAVAWHHERRVISLEERLKDKPAVTVTTPSAPPRAEVRARAPDPFSGEPDDKGAIVPSIRDFVRAVRKYVQAQHQVSPMSPERMINVTATYLTGEAAQWYEQQTEEMEKYVEDLEDRQAARRRRERRRRRRESEGAAIMNEDESSEEDEEDESDDMLDYDGPLANLDNLLEALLKEFEDVDIEATVQHKLEVIRMDQDTTAETHVRHFNHWGRHSGYNDKALMGYFRRSLPSGLQSKIRNMAERPKTLKAYQDRAIKFDRDRREDQEERRMTRPAANTGNSGNQPRAQQATPTTPRSSPQAPTTNANRTQPQTGQWRPWGSVSRPAQNYGINAVDRDPRCFKCGKTDGHIARDCPTPLEEIRRTLGRDSLFPVPTPRRTAQNRATNFANAGEFVNALSAEQRAEMAQALQSGSAQGQQDFGNGSS